MECVVNGLHQENNRDTKDVFWTWRRFLLAGKGIDRNLCVVLCSTPFGTMSHLLMHYATAEHHQRAHRLQRCDPASIVRTRSSRKLVPGTGMIRIRRCRGYLPTFT
ncbi:hypothetical protein K437DRAFT_178111 [Tilletiaria anomala UBC 951]|uniref:Uncharacterized protein n=1 Tax=Tilletiaria anomala (strain ATCC 24038 / CBS 436.72 / UBC 951) TaxID=1037660 RepID=A0A066VM31_TILAU|nr:uncharacterized protein K437DRAFT_178111 [Tilletiaria anomala UBC 951]KDN41323.1 hypothetical protein K437DRAFT_178111 [Tilletiaria anomala UBC 951]